MRYSRAVLLIIAVATAHAGTRPAPVQDDRSGFKVSGDAQAALGTISAESLKGHLSFIASDLLEGRSTPSRGLDLAAEYIAAQFRRAGVEPVGDDGFFQTANWAVAERNLDRFALNLHIGTTTTNVAKDKVGFGFQGGLELDKAPVIKLLYEDQAGLAQLKPENVQGKAVVIEIPDYRRAERSRWPQLIRAEFDFLTRLRGLNPAVIIRVERAGRPTSGPLVLIDPENRQATQRRGDLPIISVFDPAFTSVYETLKPGAGDAFLSIHLEPATERPLKLRNIAGLLRGSDPVLKDTYVLVTAHYDHIGVRPEAEGDQIFNGANDDGSGTVSVIELATALSRLKQRPKRSILFMTFFGEERGLLGSRYYARHPLFPIEKTIANINLEQVGRTDSSEGPQVATASLTGFDFSDVGEIFRSAGRLAGINVYKHERNSDSYFGRSDNQALADLGVPAHTLCVAYAYSDYHGAGDHWDKVDYANMEKINRLVAVAVLMIAESSAEPKWNESNPKAARYLAAWKQRRGKM